MVTIKELAKVCDVSIATVSNVLNQKGRVSAETVEKVQRMAKELGYVPNAFAKNLKENNTRTIGVITEDLTVFNAPEIVDGINECLEESGYTFLLGNLRLYKTMGNEFYQREEYGREVERQFHNLISKQVEGIIYVGAHVHEVHCIPDQIKIPIVMAYSFANRGSIPSVLYDDEQAGYAATVHLLQKGVEKVGVITGDRASFHARKRLCGYKKALEDYNVQFKEEYVEEGDWYRESGYQAAVQLYQRGIRAFFSMNDVMATGIYDMAHERNLVIGKDIVVVGFDNREFSKVLSPGLSTMALPLDEIGREAARMILTMTEQHDVRTEERKELLLKCKMITRESG